MQLLVLKPIKVWLNYGLSKVTAQIILRTLKPRTLTPHTHIGQNEEWDRIFGSPPKSSSPIKTEGGRGREGSSPKSTRKTPDNSLSSNSDTALLLLTTPGQLIHIIPSSSSTFRHHDVPSISDNCRHT